MKNTKRIALCGMFGALSVTIMLLGSLIPFATYMCPAIAAFFILPIVYEYKEKTSFMLYLAVSILSLILVAEKELSVRETEALVKRWLSMSESGPRKL